MTSSVLFFHHTSIKEQLRGDKSLELTLRLTMCESEPGLINILNYNRVRQTKRGRPGAEPGC